MDDLKEASHVVRFQGFELNLQTGELRKGWNRIRLQDQPFKVLAALLQRPGQLVTREELRKLIWPGESFGDFDHAINLAVAKLRGSLGDSADVPHLIETLPRRGYRFIAEVTEQNAHSGGAVVSRRSATRKVGQFGGFELDADPAIRELPQSGSKLPRRFWSVATIMVLIAALALSVVGYFYFHHTRTAKLTDKDTIVIADFTNTTGDAVFDQTLRQGLAVQLEQSPFLRLVSEPQIQGALRLMKRAPDARLTPEIAREICQRTGGAAMLDGSVAQIGAQYQLVLKAMNCSNGESLASTEAPLKLGQATRITYSMRWENWLRKCAGSSGNR